MIRHGWIIIIRRLENCKMDKSYPSKKDKSIYSKELRKLKKKYCHLDNFVPKIDTKNETKIKTEKVNVGFCK